MSAKNNIAKLYKQLLEITDWFEASDSKDIEKALEKYEEGQKLSTQLLKQLKTLENKIEKIDKDFS